MAKSQNSFNKKENEQKRLKKRKDKLQKKEDRKLNSGDGSLDSMIAYVDENGNISNTPPDPSKKQIIDVSTIEISVTRREEEIVPTTRNGRIDFFDDSKGFGFIKDVATQEKFFVHVKGLTEKVKEGDMVSFELEKGMKGMNAINVKKN